MYARNRSLLLLIVCLAGLGLVATGRAVSEPIAPMKASLGLSSPIFGFDTGNQLTATAVGVTAGVNLQASLNATPAQVRINAATATLTSNTNNGTIAFSNVSGIALMNVGLESSFTWSVKFNGQTYSGPLPKLPQINLDLQASQPVYSLLLGDPVILHASLPNQDLAGATAEIPFIGSVDISVGAMLSCQNTISGVQLASNEGSITFDSGTIPVSVNGPSASLDNLNATFRSSMVFSVTPTIDFNVSFLLLSYDIVFPTIPLSLPAVAANFATGNQTVTFPTTQIISLDGPISFGNCMAGQSATHALTIKNSGTWPLTVNSVTYPSGFSGNWSGTISPGSSQLVMVSFSPSSATNYVGSVNVHSSATSGTGTTPISGTGTSIPAAIINLSGNMAYGTVTVNSTAQQTLTISNTGNTALQVTSISCPSGFSCSWSGTIQPNNSQLVTVTFEPTATTGYGGNISINSNATGGIHTINVSGTGIQVSTAVISLTGNLNYGNLTVDSTKQLSFSIVNSGTSVLRVSSITYPSGFSGDWPGGTISPNSSQSVTVTFSPTAITPYSGSISVHSDATSGSGIISVSGTGIATSTAIMDLSGSMTFGSVALNSTAQRTLTIFNNGTAPLLVNSISLPNGFSASWPSGTIPPNGSQSVVVTFSPAAATSYSGLIAVNSNATSGTQSVLASGTGTPSGALPPPILQGPGTPTPTGATASTGADVYGFIVNMNWFPALSCEIKITDLTTETTAYQSPDWVTFTNAGQNVVVVSSFYLTPSHSYSWVAREKDPSGDISAWSAPYYFTVPLSNLPPSITGVSPVPVVASSNPQVFYINGENIVSNCNVTLRNLTAGQTFANCTIAAASTTQIQLSQYFTTAGTSWSAEIIDPDGQTSGQFPFTVVAPSAEPPIITGVQFSSSAESYTLVISGAGFGRLPTATPFTGDSPCFRIADSAQVGDGEWGYSGDAKILTYQAWSDSQITVSGLIAQPGDALAIAVWNPTTGAGVTWGGNVPGGSAITPTITSVLFTGSGQTSQVTISGSGFGNAPVQMPYSGVLDNFALTDWVVHSGYDSSFFAAGYGGWGVNGPSSVTANFVSWTSTQITISGFGGAYGQGPLILQPGDPVTFTIWSTTDSTYTGPQTTWGGSWANSTLIVTQPQSLNVAASGDASFTIGTSVANLTYQWQASIDGGSTWANLANTAPYSGTATGTLTITSVTAPMNGYLYRCIATNGVDSATSAAAVLTVPPLAPPIGVHDIFVSDHNLSPSGESGIVRIDRVTGVQSVVTQGGNLGDLFGIAYESPTSVIVVDAGGGNGLLVRVDVTTGQQTVLATGLGHAMDVALDADKNIYVTDDGFGGPGGVFKITPNGQVSTLSSGGRPGGLVYHPDGYLYFLGLDLGGGQAGIARLDPATGQWTALPAGGPIAGGIGLAVDTNGDLLVAEGGTTATTDNRIYRVDRITGAQTTISTASNARDPRAIWVNSAGALFVGDCGDNSTDGIAGVFTLDRVTGVLAPISIGNSFRNLIGITGLPGSTTAPSFEGGQPSSQTVTAGSNVSFTAVASGTPAPTYLWQLSADGGNTWNPLSDSALYGGTMTGTLTITSVTAPMNGYLYRCIATNGVDSATSAAAVLTVPPLAPPIGVHDIFVSDHNLSPSGESGIVRIDRVTGVQSVVTQGGNLGDLFGIAYESPTSVIVVDAGGGNGLLVRVDVTTGQQTVLATGLGHAMDVALDADKNIYVTDDGFGGPGGVFKITPNGQVSTLSSGGRPGGLVYHPDGYLYFLGLDLGGGQAGIARLDPATGQWTALPAGGPIAGGIGLAVDTNGDLLVAEGGTTATTDNRIYRVDRITGAQTTISTASNARDPRAIWVNSAGALFVGDCGDNSTDGIAGVFTLDRVTGVLAPISIGNSFRNLIGITGLPGSTTAPSFEGGQPSSQTVTAGSNVSFTAVASGTPAPTYLWQLSADGGNTWNPLSDSALYGGTATGTLTITGATLAMNGYEYQCLASNSVQSNVVSLPAALTVNTANAAPSFTTQPGNQTVTAGGTASFTAAASGTPAPSYYWQIGSSITNTWAPIGNTAPYSGVATATLTITGATADMNGLQYRCLANNGVGPDGAYSNAATLTVNKAAATVTLGNLAATYNGTAHSATATTAPIGLTVSFTYNGSSTAPTNVGSYTVVGTISDANYQGSASGTLVIGQATATVTLGSLSATYNGAAHSVTATTAPTGLTVSFTYNGSTTAPTNAGSYTIVGTISDTNFQGNALGSLAIAKAPLTAKADDKTKAQGTANPPLTITYSGFVNGETAAVIATPPTISTTATTSSPAGTYPITLTGGNAANYALTLLNGVLTINPTGAPVFTVQPSNQSVMDGGSFTVNVTVSTTDFAVVTWKVTLASGRTIAASASSSSQINNQIQASVLFGPVAKADAGTFSVIATNQYGSTASDPKTLTVTAKTKPTLLWFQPAAITYGTALSAAQLNAVANVPGTFVYTPAAGTVLNAGIQTLSVTFTPTDTADYTTAMATQTLTVISAAYQAFLQKIFPLVLGRQIDSGALSAYVSAMSTGDTRSQVYADLISSAEYNLRQIEPAMRLYYAALARVPDYDGLQNWANALHAGTLTLTGAADQFAASAEFRLKYGSLDNTGYVQQLYRNVLGREAEPAGLANWLDHLNAGDSRGAVLVGFSESDEFKQKMANQVEIVRLYYLLEQRMPTATELQSWIGFLNGDDQTDTLFAQSYPADLADTDYVQLVFQGFLRRPADSGALSTFGTALTAGTVTHSGLVDTLLGSAEFNQCVGPVSRLYMAAFRRVPDAGGLDNWVGYVRPGNSLQSAADYFASSPEFQLTYGSLDNTQYVTLLYENVLGREPDPTGLATWTGHLSSGWTRGQVLIGFSESQEGIALFAPTVRTFLHYFTFLNTTPAQSDLNYWKNYLATLDDQLREDFLADPTFTNGG
jgi:MBG domain/Domain of unknown function (DUF4214)/MBG domain (YGX type)/Abnormal spindle-like microcephaly-assoc'd, ASPM-SPD-2-Hydin/Immunoglobulin domain